MTKQMKAAMAAMLMVGTLPMQAQTATKTTHKKHHKVVKKEAVESETTRELRELREKQAAQQAEIDALKQANATANAALAQAQTAAQGAEAQAQVATQQAQSVTTTVQATSDQVQALKANVSDLQTTNAGLAATISANKVELTEKIDSPSTLHYKGITITPVFWVAGEGVWRQRALNSDINTPLNSIPYMGASEAHTTELNFTARQTRLGALFQGNTGTTKLSGYFESDFLGAGVTSNDNQSNSYVFRVRQAWGKAEKKGTAIAFGQMWSLVTEDGHGTDNRTEKQPNTIDPQYLVGYNWTRQPGFRFQQALGDPKAKVGATFAFSLEQPQIQGFTSAATPANFFIDGAGNTSGLYNSTGNTSTSSGTPATAVQSYSVNQAPDVITKFALDVPHGHFEVGGLARFFRERLYPGAANSLDPSAVVTGALPYNNTVLAGGAFASLRVSPAKFLDVAVQGMAGDGTGRYGSEQLGDATVHPNGTLEPIRNYHGLFALETHPSPKFDVYAYYGGAYEQRTVYATGVAASPFTGYAPVNLSDTGCNTEVTPTGANNGLIAPEANCSGLTRYLQEYMIGFTYKAINSPKYGQLQYRATYSYIQKNAWTGLTGGTFGAASETFGAPKATDGMVHVSVRYYIP